MHKRINQSKLYQAGFILKLTIESQTKYKRKSNHNQCISTQKVNLDSLKKRKYLLSFILQMQQVIRSLHNKKHRQLQRKKIKQLTPQQFFNNIHYYSKSSTQPHKVLQHQYQHLRNLSYNGLQKMSQHKLYPLSHIFAYQPLMASQIKEQQLRSRSISEKNQFLRHYNPSVYTQNKLEFQRKQDPKIFPKIILKKPRSKARKKLRCAFLAVFFCILVKSQFKQLLKGKRQRCLKSGKMCVQQAIISFQEYYYDLLQQQITQYMLILQNRFRYKQYDYGKDVVRMLTFMTNKLNHSPIPKSLVYALELTVTNYSFYPFPFLFEQIAQRLKFSKRGCSIEVNNDQSFMIGACFMGIGMLCYNLLYRPWLLEDLFRKKQKRQFKITTKYNQLKELIHGVGSIIYFLVIDNFISNVPVIDKGQQQSDELLKQNQLKLAPNLKIVVQTIQQTISSSEDSSSQQQQNKVTKLEQKMQAEVVNQQDEIKIIIGQDRWLFNELKQDFESQMRLIQQNLKQWIIKAVLVAIKKVKSQAQQRKRQLNREKDQK